MSNNLYSKTAFAEKVGVHKSRISKLIKDGKLFVSRKTGIELISDCESNLSLFKDQSVFRGKKRPKKGEKWV